MPYGPLLNVILLGTFVGANSQNGQDPLGRHPTNHENSTNTIYGLDITTRRYIEDIVDHFHVPSFSIAVLKANDTYFDVCRDDTQAFGQAILPSTAASPETLYYIASCTKSFTAASLLYALNAYSSEDSRLGVPRHDLSYDGDGFGLENLTRSLRYLPMHAEFREKWSYLNIGYMVLQHIIQKLTGLWVGEAQRQAIWDPLGMDSTVIKLADALRLDKKGSSVLSHGYSYNYLTDSFTRQPWNNTELVGGGGIISSVSDMSKWFEHMGPLLYAMGWETSTYRGQRLVMHSGNLPGYTSLMAFLPELQWGLTILTNGDGSSDQAVQSVFLKLIDDFLGVAEGNREDIIPALDADIRHELDQWVNTRSRIYPEVPSPPEPRAHPLEAYVGRYWNDGYRELDLRITSPLPHTPVHNDKKQILRCDWRRFKNFTIELEWISGEQFLAWIETEAFSPQLSRGVQALFVTPQHGQVEIPGIYLDNELMELEKMIWFDRITVDESHGGISEL
ncbi:beta-lactamase/transpeptidase-like protein [Xylariales sp. PMI_506]|nr:beta-lactamase/transpeptidase-like protein [Xylariales sp. PMI_506]